MPSWISILTTLVRHGSSRPSREGSTLSTGVVLSLCSFWDLYQKDFDDGHVRDVYLITVKIGRSLVAREYFMNLRHSFFEPGIRVIEVVIHKQFRAHVNL